MRVVRVVTGRKGGFRVVPKVVSFTIPSRNMDGTRGAHVNAIMTISSRRPV